MCAGCPDAFRLQAIEAARKAAGFSLPKSKISDTIHQAATGISLEGIRALKRDKELEVSLDDYGDNHLVWRIRMLVPESQRGLKYLAVTTHIKQNRRGK